MQKKIQYIDKLSVHLLMYIKGLKINFRYSKSHVHNGNWQTFLKEHSLKVETNSLRSRTSQLHLEGSTTHHLYRWRLGLCRLCWHTTWGILQSFCNGCILKKVWNWNMTRNQMISMRIMWKICPASGLFLCQLARLGVQKHGTSVCYTN